MVFEWGNLLWWVAFFLAIWLVIISYFLFKTIVNYNRLTKGVTDQTLSDVLSNLLKQHTLREEEIKQVFKELSETKKLARGYVQKIGVVRFNPFADTGGDQSFTLALLDGNDDGFVITSLYARTGTRWYVKTVKKGAGVEHDLSDEEKKALKNAHK